MPRKKGIKQAQAKPRAKAKAKKKAPKGKGITFGLKQGPSAPAMAPAAVSTNIKLQAPRILGSISHKEEGQGILVSGIQRVGILRATGSGYLSFGEIGSGTRYHLLNPSAIASSRLFDLAFPWSKFRYHSVKYHIRTRVGTGNLVVTNTPSGTSSLQSYMQVAAYIKDPTAITTIANNSSLYNELTELQPSVELVHWRDAMISLGGGELGTPDGMCYFIDVNATFTDEAQRLSFQGGFIAGTDYYSSSWANDGLLVHDVLEEYVVALYGPRPPIDLSLSHPSCEACRKHRRRQMPIQELRGSERSKDEYVEVEVVEEQPRVPRSNSRPPRMEMKENKSQK